jgi:hypothetical protein
MPRTPKENSERPLQRVPTRTLLAAIKQDIRKQLRAAQSSGKPKKIK